jgi:hypothetical protein
MKCTFLYKKEFQAKSAPKFTETALTLISTSFSFGKGFFSLPFDQGQRGHRI